MKSPIYRLIKFLTPSILPKSSTCPFLLTLILGGLQLKRLWRSQPQLLINLSISITPTINTLRVLTRSETNRIRAQTDKDHGGQAQDYEDQRELQRWAVYWLIYCTIINLESCKVPFNLTNHSSSAVTRPATSHTIPIDQDQFHRHRKISIILKNLRILSRYLLNLIPKPIRSFQLLKIPVRSLGVRTPRNTPNSKSKNVQVRLPDYLFGKRHRKLYHLFKFLFLRWCSSDSYRGSQSIWSNVLSPILNLIHRADHDLTAEPHRQTGVKVVKVIISQLEDHQHPSNPTHSATQIPGLEAPSDLKLPNRSINQLTDESVLNSINLNQETVKSDDTPTKPIIGRTKESRLEDRSPHAAFWAVRRIKSDPMPSCTNYSDDGSSLIKRSSIKKFELSPNLQTDFPHRLDHSTEASIFHSGICLDSLESHPSKPFEEHHLHRLSPPKKNIAGSHSPHPHHLLDLKTPENAWDSLSLIG